MPDRLSPRRRERASKRRPAEPGADARQRLWRAFTRPSRAQVAVAILLALVGFAGVTQVRANQVDDTYAGLRQQDLIDILNSLAGNTQRAESEIRRLEAARDDLQSDTNARRAALEQARGRVQALSVLAGTVPVRGPGVVITITEVSGAVQVSPFIDMIQALRTAGAEAMQINATVRVVAQTSFDDAAGGLLVDEELVEPPYVVEVIGEPEALAAALRFPDGPRDQFAEDGAELTFNQRMEVEIRATRELTGADLARPRQ